MKTATIVNKWMALTVAGIALAAASCKKEVKGIDIPTLSTVWERAAGNYKVYDTLGNYLYEMKLTHWRTKDQSGKDVDTIRIENFDDQFVFSAQQLSPNPDNFPNHIRFGTHNAIYDKQGKRWKLNAAVMLEDYNNFVNDTIKLRFQKTNINYYLSDLTPYYSCDCKQVAVKQH